MRARGQRATAIEATNGILRHPRHAMEAELNRLDIPLVFTRLLHEALIAASAFTFYEEVFPCNALFGRQPAMDPELPVLEHAQPTETSDHSREQTMHKVCIGAMTQATAVAKTSRALRTKTSVAGQHYYDEGDLVDYHRPTTTKDDWGG
eukprot:2303619-Pyramimonas_sp.AAC.1